MVLDLSPGVNVPVVTSEVPFKANKSSSAAMMETSVRVNSFGSVMMRRTKADKCLYTKEVFPFSHFAEA